MPPRIKSKFHENKDWNFRIESNSLGHAKHQEQVPRKQGLKQSLNATHSETPIHQEQVPRKQGLKLLKSPELEKYRPLIKSKFHENKDWNGAIGHLSIPNWFIKSKFHENKDWNKETTHAIPQI